MNQLQELFFWTIDNKDKLHIEYGTKKLGLKSHLASLKMRFEGIEVIGSGVSESIQEAIGKATAECIERVVVRAHKLGTTNGASAHFLVDEAIRSSYNELIERDAFLFHFHWLQLPFDIKNDEIRSDLYTFSFSTSDPLLFVKGVFSSSTMVLGLGCGDSEISALKKAYSEFFSIEFSIEGYPILPIELPDFLELPFPKPIDHLRLSKSDSYRKKLLGWPLKGKAHVLRDFNPKDNFKFKLYDPPGILKTSGLVVSHGQNEDLISYYLGDPRKGLLSQTQAVKIATQACPETLSLLPHPFS